MIIVGNTLIEPDIPRAEFCCDLAACKGGCCTLEGGRGAPLEDPEVGEIRKALPLVFPLLAAEQQETIARTGGIEGPPGDSATVCVRNRECVFAYFDGPVARCSFEKVYLEGRSAWRKPVSCHLYPIRVRSAVYEVLRYDRIEECAAGRARGHAEGVLLHEFLREPLSRRFGEEWWSAFSARCKEQG